MDDTGVLSYNKPRGTIAAGEHIEVVTDLLPDDEQ